MSFKSSKFKFKSSKLNLNKNIDKFLFVFIILLFSSGASIISASDELLVFFTIVSCILIFKKNNIHEYLIKLLKITLFISVLLFIYFIKNNSTDINTWIGFYCRILLAYNVVTLTKGFFHFYLIELMFWLCIISLILYSLQLIAFDQLFQLNNLFGKEAYSGLSGNSNSLIFNMIDIHNNRNCGFMWEPGAFSAIIIFTLFFCFLIDIKFDKYKMVFIISLLTTFSTTGYLALISLITYFYFPKFKFLTPILLLLFIIAILNINFLSSKISSQILSIQDELISTEKSEQYSIHLNRFSSFVADLQVFENNPLLGLGIDFRTTNKKLYFKEYDENVVRSSGLMFGLLEFGILGMSSFLFFLSKRISIFTKNNSLGLLFCFIYLLIIFSNPMEFSVFVLTFIFI